MNSFKEKYGPWGLIVGASDGLGALFAENCAKRGLNIVICARRQNKLDAVAQKLQQKYDIKTRTVRIDIMNDDCAETIEATIEDLDIGFYLFNAAAEAGGLFVRTKLEDHLHNIAGNCITPTKLTWYIARKMAARGKGAMYLIASIAGQGGIANWSSYGASKSYELILGEGLWYEMKQYGVDAGTYVVGSTETPEFKASQQKHQTGLSGSSKMKGFLNHVAKPKTPQMVADAFFRQIGSGPRFYSSFSDAAASKFMQIMTRRQSVNLISSVTEKYFHGGRNDLLDDPAVKKTVSEVPDGMEIPV